MKTLLDYHAACLRTAAVPGENGVTEKRQMVWGLGIAGEAGEVADILKKHYGHGKPFDRAHFIQELGDVLWYVTALAYSVGSDLEEVARVNDAKLRARYPDGFKAEYRPKDPGEVDAVKAVLR